MTMLATLALLSFFASTDPNAAIGQARQLMNQKQYEPAVKLLQGATLEQLGAKVVDHLASLTGAPATAAPPASVPEPPAEPGADTERALSAWGLGAAEIARLAGVRD